MGHTGSVLRDEWEEIIRVYTKYDTPPESFSIPSFKPIVIDDLKIIAEVGAYHYMFEYTKYTIKKIEHGLEGVRYFRYTSREEA